MGRIGVICKTNTRTIDLLKQLQQIWRAEPDEADRCRSTSLYDCVQRVCVNRTAVDPYASSFDRAWYLVRLVRITSPYASAEAELSIVRDGNCLLHRLEGRGTSHRTKNLSAHDVRGRIRHHHISSRRPYDVRDTYGRWSIILPEPSTMQKSNRAPLLGRRAYRWCRPRSSV